MMNIKQKRLLKRLVLGVMLPVCVAAAILLLSIEASKDRQGEIIRPLLALTPAASINTESYGIEEMDKVAASGDIELYLNRNTLTIAVKNRSTGQTWYSSPEDNPAVDKTDSGKYRANISITTDYLGQKTVYNSFDDCAALGNYEIETIADGVRIKYIIGQTRQFTVNDLPVVVRKAVFEEAIISKLSAADAKKVSRRYTLYSKDGNIDAQVWKEISAKYPVVNEQDVYIIDPKIPDFVAQEIKVLLDSISFGDEEIVKENQANGVLIERKPAVNFSIVSDFILENGTLRATLDCSYLKNFKEDSIYISSVGFLEYFGAANSDDKEGFIFLPDGSGARIGFDTPDSVYAPVSLNVYGGDKSIRQTTVLSNSRQTCFPVFALKSDDQAFFALIDQGDTLAQVSTHLATANTPYNSVYSSYNVTPNDIVDAGYSNTSEQQFLNVCAQEPYGGLISVSYAFLSGDEAGIPGMAKECRRMFFERGYLEDKRTDHTDIGINIELIGAIDKKSSLLGLVPIDRTIALTTFNDAQKILSSLAKSGITDITARYLGWFNGGLNQKAIDKVKPERVLGGSRGLQELQDFAKAGEVQIYYDAALMKIVNRKGFNYSSDAVKAIGNVYAKIFKTDIATGTTIGSRYGYLLSPGAFSDYTAKFSLKLAKLGITDLSLNDAGLEMYSDNADKHYFNSEQTKQALTAAIDQNLADQKIMVSGTNLYMLKYADFIADMPLDSSSYYSEESSVPFMQMVLHSYVDYSGYNINNAYDYEEQMLRSVEYGAVPCFRVQYIETNELKGSEYSDQFSTSFKVWESIIKDYYFKVNATLKPLIRFEITDNYMAAENVACTLYENGTRILVNYNDHDVVFEGVTIKARDWATIE